MNRATIGWRERGGGWLGPGLGGWPLVLRHSWFPLKMKPVLHGTGSGWWRRNGARDGSLAWCGRDWHCCITGCAAAAAWRYCAPFSPLAIDRARRAAGLAVRRARWRCPSVYRRSVVTVSLCLSSERRPPRRQLTTLSLYRAAARHPGRRASRRQLPTRRVRRHPSIISRWTSEREHVTCARDSTGRRDGENVPGVPAVGVSSHVQLRSLPSTSR